MTTELNSLIELIILSLAVWRVSSLLVKEEGIFGMFVYFRHFIGIRYTYPVVTNQGELYNKTLPLKDVLRDYDDIVSSPEEYQLHYKYHFSKAFTCIWCISIWVGLLLSLLVTNSPSEVLLFCLASSSLSIFFQERLL